MSLRLVGVQDEKTSFVPGAFLSPLQFDSGHEHGYGYGSVNAAAAAAAAAAVQDDLWVFS